MKPLIRTVPILALILPFAATQSRAADTGTPEEQFAAVSGKYRPVSAGLREAGTDLDRKAHVERISKFPAKFLDVAEIDPGNPVALKALRQAFQIANSTDSAALTTWEMNQSEFPAGANDGSADRAVEFILRHHLESKDIAPLVDRARYGYRMEFEKFLDTVLRENPHHEIQGQACLFLAQNLNDKLRMLQLAEDRPELTKRYNIVFGKDFLQDLRRLKETGTAKRIEALFERATEEYGDVKIRNGTVGEQAKRELFGIRNLAVGMTAPEMEGKDQDGVEFKLSDYRGKVVLLYFWMEY